MRLAPLARAAVEPPARDEGVTTVLVPIEPVDAPHVGALAAAWRGATRASDTEVLFVWRGAPADAPEVPAPARGVTARAPDLGAAIAAGLGQGHGGRLCVVSPRVVPGSESMAFHHAAVAGSEVRVGLLRRGEGDRRVWEPPPKRHARERDRIPLWHWLTPAVSLPARELDVLRCVLPDLGSDVVAAAVLARIACAAGDAPRLVRERGGDMRLVRPHDDAETLAALGAAGQGVLTLATIDGGAREVEVAREVMRWGALDDALRQTCRQVLAEMDDDEGPVVSGEPLAQHCRNLLHMEAVHAPILSRLRAEGATALRRRLGRDPADYEHFRARGACTASLIQATCLKHRGDVARALVKAGAARARFPASPSAAYVFGTACFERSRLGEAQEHLEEAWRLYTCARVEEPIAFGCALSAALYLAHAQRLAGRLDEAEATVARACRHAPYMEPLVRAQLWRVRAAIAERRGEAEAARQCARYASWLDTGVSDRPPAARRIDRDRGHVAEAAS
jgi:hypothetical protein